MSEPAACKRENRKAEGCCLSRTTEDVQAAGVSGGGYVLWVPVGGHIVLCSECRTSKLSGSELHSHKSASAFSSHQGKNYPHGFRESCLPGERGQSWFEVVSCVQSEVGANERFQTAENNFTGTDGNWALNSLLDLCEKGRALAGVWGRGVRAP